MNPESGTSTTTPALYTENEWPDFNEFIIVVEEEEGKDENSFREFTKLIEQHEQVWKPAKEELETINVGDEENQRELKIGTLITQKEKEDLITLLRDYVDVFAWSYEDIPGLDTNIIVHRVPLEEGCRPIKQKLRRTHPEILIKVKAEIEKQWNAGFLEVVKYPQWVSNIVVVPIKEGKIRIKMAQEDKEKITFVTPWGTFCYKVMPFGLKNAGATYQRAMVTLFHDMMHKEIEVYVDDMIAKSGEGENHVQILKKLFERLRKYKLRLNPAKCSFGVKSGKLLGFVVSDKGIEVDHEKVKAIQAMPAPKTEKEVRGFLGRLNYIARFISQLTTTCDPIFRLLRKKNPGIWNAECEEAFEKIKQYLLNPPLLVPPVPKRPLILYLTVTETAMGCVLGQQDESGRKERAIYYLSKKFMECESRYTMIEKLCCALAWAAKRLRQYMLYHTTWLISKLDPLKYICEKPYLSSRIARWQEGKLEWWTMYFDGAVNICGNGAGAVIMSLDKKQYPVSTKLQFGCTNNTAEYEACILGLETALELNVKKIDVYGDSMLIICQVKGEWQTKEEKLIPYQEYLSRLAEEFEEIEFTHLGREGNQFADALATLASMAKIDFGQNLQPIHIDIRNNPAHCCSVEGEIDGNPWYYDIKNFIQNQVYPMGASNIEKKTLRRLAMDFYLDGEVLYKRSSDGTLLRCLDENEARDALRENFNGKLITELCAKWKIKHSNSSPYRPKMNGAVEAANKNIKKIVQKMVVTYKDWHEMLPFALYAYRTAVRTSTGATPYMLVYGMEAVMPLEVEIPSLRVLIDSELEEAEWAKKILLVPGQDQSKWAPNYEGPYVVKKSFSGRALLLSRMDGEDLVRPVNSDSVKKYYA
ncbi:RNA-directed DNA polymerase (Reverse transcriptase), Ribonuclease [Salix suchowensis]|nr:RNA-directed DNA polymerase (Reverse transcriptase), Ribonuclease [Salix suchowensis]